MHSKRSHDDLLNIGGGASLAGVDRGMLGETGVGGPVLDEGLLDRVDEDEKYSEGVLCKASSGRPPSVLAGLGGSLLSFCASVSFSLDTIHGVP
jgi:hypothetical protein